MTAPGPIAVLIATQNLNAVLRIMQWGVIALIFLFFLRVVRAVWVEMSPATVRKTRAMRRQERREERAAVRPAAQPRPSRRRQLYLKVVQPPEHVGTHLRPRRRADHRTLTGLRRLHARGHLHLDAPRAALPA